MHNEEFTSQSHESCHDDLFIWLITTKKTLIRMPVWLKVTGKRIIELPIMELAIATPDMKVDLPMNYISIYFISRNIY